MLSKASFQNRRGDEEAGELITSLKTSENSFTCFPTDWKHGKLYHFLEIKRVIKHVSCKQKQTENKNNT